MALLLQRFHMMSARFRLVAALLMSGLGAWLLSPAPLAQGQDVTWTNLVNVTVNGNLLQKTGGCDGCADAGATSQETISAGDGYVEFTVNELTTFWFAGLSHGNDDAGYGDIDFAFRFNGGGAADVLENGIYQGGDTQYAVGDVFRVAVAGGRVQYFKNGQFIHESAAAPQYPLLLDTSLGTMGATIRDARLGVTAPPSEGEGLLEKAGSPQLRPRFTRAQIDAFLPPGGAKGKFTFPSPYNTVGIRLTNASDCDGGQDCVWYIGYSYWRNTNNHVASADMLILLGTDRNRGGAGPTLIRYNKVTDEVQNAGPLFDPSSLYSYSTGEGWYFSGSRPTALYTFMVGGTELRRYDVIARQFDLMPAMDLAQCRRPAVCPAAAAFINQPHSSDDDRVHSATIQDAAYQRLGCVVYREATRKFAFYPPPAGYDLDECQIDKSGRWLMLLETTSSGAVSNRIIDLRNNTATRIDDAQGALGHLDLGFGYAVGADNWNPLPNATILLKFPVTSTTRPIGPVVHFNKRWDIVAANHITHGNASAALAPESQYACGSNASRTTDMADEIVCFPLNANRNADGSLDVLAVGQVMTDLNAPGGDLSGDDYAQLPKGNLDVSGSYFIWTTNLGGDRLDAFLVKVPGWRLNPPDPPARTRAKQK